MKLGVDGDLFGRLIPQLFDCGFQRDLSNCPGPRFFGMSASQMILDVLLGERRH